MKRFILNKLLRWKESDIRKPLLLRGARQVGKTWVMKEFGRLHYKQILYVNFERDKLLQNLFVADFDLERILSALQIQSGVIPEAENTLIILDEIQEAAGALTALKYFQEEAPEYHIIGAGSLLGVTLNQKSFPVGKVQFLEMHPMSFSEFLEAVGGKELLKLLEEKDWELIRTFHKKYVDLLKQYYFVGGMPEVVNSFRVDGDYETVRALQNQILQAYELDFSKHTPQNLIPRVRQVWQSLPSQLSRENRKFVYGLIKHGARAREYEGALEWLDNYGLIHRVYRVSKPELPLRAYEDLKAFKIYALDVGLLGALSGLDVQILLNKTQLFSEFKGALTEQFVLQELLNKTSFRPNYWTNKSSTNEVDFIIAHKNQVFPIEVKAEENLQSKSLRVYHNKFDPPKSIRTSLAGYRDDGWLVNIPLYAVYGLQRILSEILKRG